MAGKLKLGCEACLPSRSAAPAVTDRPCGGPAAAGHRAAKRASAAPGSAGSARPASGTPRDARSRPVPADKPVPPQAKRRPVVPPKVRREQQKATATLAERLWCAVAADDRRAIRRILHPGSPAAAIDRVLGPAGLCRVLGMPPGEEPTRFLAEANGDVVTGALLGTAGAECPYHIYCPGRAGGRSAALPRGRGRSLLGVLLVGPARAADERQAGSLLPEGAGSGRRRAGRHRFGRGTDCRSPRGPWPHGHGSPTIMTGCFPRIRRARLPRQ